MRVVVMRNLGAVLVTAGILLPGCGNGQTTASPQSAGQASAPPGAASGIPTAQPTSTRTGESSRGTVVKTGSSQFGDVLFDSSGQAIYLFDKEKTAKPECYGDCAKAWPPVLTKGEAIAAGGVRPNALGTTKRMDGTTQVTYAGHPLYYYAHEGKNEVRCHNVSGFGGLWLAVTPGGEAAPP